MTMNSDDFFARMLSVLIVDSDTEAREDIQSAFARLAIGTDCYGNEEQAMEMVRLHHARRQEYDLILVDRSLPTKNGQEVVEEIRALLGENAPTVIILTDDGSSLPTKMKATSSTMPASLTSTANGPFSLRHASRICLLTRLRLTARLKMRLLTLTIIRHTASRRTMARASLCSEKR